MLLVFPNCETVMLQGRNSCFSLSSSAETTLLMKFASRCFPQVPVESLRKKQVSSELDLIVACCFLCLHLTLAPLVCFLSYLKQRCALSCRDLRFAYAHLRGLLVVKLGSRHKKMLVPMVFCGYSSS